MHEEKAKSRIANCLSKILFVSLCFTSLPCSAVCTFPIFRVFGVNDNFSLSTPDPIPYNPAFPQFVTFLNNSGLSSSVLTTFDNQMPNLHRVATLRHGLRSCFGQATALLLCFRARALSGSPQNDGVVIYDTNFQNNTFPVIYTSAIIPTLIASWNPGTTSTLCINLTTQMPNIGAMLQFRVQDDTAVDFIAMVLF